MEDDPGLCAAYRRCLAPSVVTCVTRLDDGRERWESGAFDWLVLDFGLPDGNGRHWVQAMQPSAHRRLIVVSGELSDADRWNATDLGFRALRKPVPMQQLRRLLAVPARRLSGRPVEASVVNGYLERALSAASALYGLTPTQSAVVRLYMKGGSAQHVRAALGVANSTFEKHQSAIRRKCGVREVQQLAAEVLDDALRRAVRKTP